MNRIQQKIFYDKNALSDGGSEEILCYGHFNVIHPGHIRLLKFVVKKYIVNLGYLFILLIYVLLWLFLPSSFGCL